MGVAAPRGGADAAESCCMASDGALGGADAEGADAVGRADEPAAPGGGAAVPPATAFCCGAADAAADGPPLASSGVAAFSEVAVPDGCDLLPSEDDGAAALGTEPDSTSAPVLVPFGSVGAAVLLPDLSSLPLPLVTLPTTEEEADADVVALAGGCASGSGCNGTLLLPPAPSALDSAPSGGRAEGCWSLSAGPAPALGPGAGTENVWETVAGSDGGRLGSLAWAAAGGCGGKLAAGDPNAACATAGIAWAAGVCGTEVAEGAGGSDVADGAGGSDSAEGAGGSAKRALEPPCSMTSAVVVKGPASCQCVASVTEVARRG